MELKDFYDLMFYDKGKYLIVENLETLKQRVAAIEKVLP